MKIEIRGTLNTEPAERISSEDRPRVRRRAGSNVQKIFGFLGIAFLLFLGASVFGTRERTGAVIGGQGNTEAVKEADDDSKLHLQDFSRVQVKEGRQKWQINARDAKYYAKENVTYVNDADVLVYRDNAAPIRLKSRSAKLHMEGEELLRADLEGNVNVELESGSTVTTEAASYISAEDLVSSPEMVTVEGPGYTIEGHGMRFAVQSSIVELLDDVSSVFESGAKVPLLEDLGKNAQSRPNQKPVVKAKAAGNKKPGKAVKSAPKKIASKGDTKAKKESKKRQSEKGRK